MSKQGFPVMMYTGKDPADIFSLTGITYTLNHGDTLNVFTGEIVRAKKDVIDQLIELGEGLMDGRIQALGFNLEEDVSSGGDWVKEVISDR